MVQSETTILRTLVSIAQQQGPDAMPAFQSLVSAHQYRGLYDMFRRYVPVGAKVLDWGVGNAHFSYFLVQSGYRAAGFSLEPCTLPAWLPQDGYRLVQGSFDDPVHLPFPDQSFDVVASIGVLEHVRETGGDELKSLAEIRRVVRPGGLFLCYHLPNQYSAIEAMNRWVLTHRHHHAYRFTRDRIRRLLEEAGLELVEARRYGFLPRNIWHGAPAQLRNKPGTARAWDALDAVCEKLLAPLCQSYAVVARRPATAER